MFNSMSALVYVLVISLKSLASNILPTIQRLVEGAMDVSQGEMLIFGGDT